LKLLSLTIQKLRLFKDKGWPIKLFLWSDTLFFISWIWNVLQCMSLSKIFSKHYFCFSVSLLLHAWILKVQRNKNLFSISLRLWDLLTCGLDIFTIDESIYDSIHPATPISVQIWHLYLWISIAFCKFITKSVLAPKEYTQFLCIINKIFALNFL